MAKTYKDDSLGNRMKTYEDVPKNTLMLGCPKIIRLDMRTGHTFCRHFDRPFDEVFSDSMVQATKELCAEIPAVVAGYTQSDEISLIINDTADDGNVFCFFDGSVEKIVSVSASICTLAFNRAYAEIVSKLPEDKRSVYEKNLWKAQFDSRVFCLPNVVEVHNYLLWRQLDATRNSIQMAGHANFTQKEMHGKNSAQIQDMLVLERGINWNDYKSRYKRGCVILKEQYTKTAVTPQGVTLDDVKRSRWIEYEIPILTKDTEFVEKVFNHWLVIDDKLVKPE